MEQVARTALTPGQSDNPNAMPFEDLIDEAIRLFQQQRTPSEILVQRVHAQRYAERDGTFDAIASRLAGF